MTEPLEEEFATAERDRLREALREIADYRNNDAQLRALHIARAALAASPTMTEGGE